MIDIGTRVILLVTVATIAAAVHRIARPRAGRIGLVRVPGRNEADARRASRRMRIVNALSVGPAIAVILGEHATGTMLAIAVVTAALVPASWMMLELAVAFRKTAPSPVAGRFRVSLERSPTLLSRLSPWRQLLAASALIAPAAILWHWNAGDPGPWAFFVPFLLFIDALLLTMAALELRTRPALPVADEERYAALRDDKQRILLRILESAMVAWNTAGGLIWLAVAFDSTGPADIVAITAIALAGPFLAAWIARDVGRLVALADAMDQAAGSTALGTHRRGWHLGGLLYYAPDDPALAVVDPSGLGQRLNLARRGARWMLAAVLAAPLLLATLALC